MDTNIHGCKFLNVLRYSGKLVSAWVTVAICVERFMAVVFPLKIAQLSTLKTTKIIIGIITLVSFILGAFPLWTLYIYTYDFELNISYCGVKDSYDSWNWAVLRVGSLYLPAVIIFIFTFLLVRGLRKMASDSTDQFEGQQAATASQSINAQLTKMLIGVCIMFLLFRLPYTVAYNIDYYYLFSDDVLLINTWGDYVSKIFLNVTDILATSNYALNFFLYFVTGSKFRMQLITLLSCKKNPLRQSVTASIRLSQSSAVSQRRRDAKGDEKAEGVTDEKRNGERHEMREEKKI